MKPILVASLEATDSPYTFAQSYGASALASLAQRRDGVELLQQASNSILKLLDRNEPRLKLTCVILMKWARMPVNV